MTMTVAPQCIASSGARSTPSTADSIITTSASRKAAARAAAPAPACSVEARCGSAASASAPAAHSRPGSSSSQLDGHDAKRAVAGGGSGGVWCEERLVDPAAHDEAAGLGAQVGQPGRDRVARGQEVHGEVVGQLCGDALGVPGADAVVGEAVDPVGVPRRRHLEEARRRRPVGRHRDVVAARGDRVLHGDGAGRADRRAALAARAVLGQGERHLDAVARGEAPGVRADGVAGVGARQAG